MYLLTLAITLDSDSYCFYNDVLFFFSVNIFSFRRGDPTVKCHRSKKFGKWMEMVLYLERFMKF